MCITCMKLIKLCKSVFSRPWVKIREDEDIFSVQIYEAVKAVEISIIYLLKGETVNGHKSVEYNYTVRTVV